MNKHKHLLLKLSGIILDKAIQPRSHIHDAVVAKYAEAMRQGNQFPPIIIYYDEGKYWLADGFHRFLAKQANDEQTIIAEVRTGSRREAKLFAVGANLDFGFQRSNTDKRRAVERLLHDEEWSCWSNREIARRCGVDPKTVNKLRKKLLNGSKSIHFGEDCPQIQNFTNDFQAQTRRIVRRKGKPYEMNITKIGC